LQPLFEGGMLLHQKRASVAAYDKAEAQYESTVLQAFKNVADTLRALQFDAEGLKAQVNAEQAARSSLDLAQTQFGAGAISYTQLLDAQRTYAQARIGLVQAQAARFADTAALFQALGGGWGAEKNAQKTAEKTVTTSVPAPADARPALPAAPAPSVSLVPPAAPQPVITQPAVKSEKTP
jgi:outer membrane protein TolC